MKFELRSMAIMAAMGVALTAAGAQAKKQVKVALQDAQGKDAGTATFRQGKKHLKVHVVLMNLPVGDHAVHVHAVGKCEAPDFKSAGGHFNPSMKKHGFMSTDGHHDGDFPESVTVGEDHRGEKTFNADYLSLDPSAANSIFANGGTSVVVHEKKDDQMTDPAGASGNRIACGVVPAA